MIRDLNKKEAANIGEAVLLLHRLADLCPGLHDLPTFDEEVAKLDRLTAFDEIEDNFKSADPEDIGGDQAHTERLLWAFGPDYVVISRAMLASDRYLDPDDCDDAAALLQLAIILWHEAHHWNDWVDGPIQDVELEMMEHLVECLGASDHPCKQQMIDHLRQQAIPDNEMQKEEAGSGWGNWLIKWIARGALSFIAILLLLALILGTDLALGVFLAIGAVLTLLFLLWYWLSQWLCVKVRWVERQLHALWRWVRQAKEEFVVRQETTRRQIVRLIRQQQWVQRQRRVRTCSTWPYGTQWMCTATTWVVQLFWELVTVFVRVVEWVVTTISVIVWYVVWLLVLCLVWLVVLVVKVLIICF